MNIFATSPDPNLSAQALDDKRLNKMILETAQLLSTVITKLGGKTAYSPTHGLHPCTLWAGESRENFNWLAMHGVHLANEYAARFPNRPRHLSYQVILDAAKQRHLLPPGPQTMFANCTPFKHLIDPTVAYRLLLNCKWHADKRTPTWTERAPPAWIIPQKTDLDRVMEKLACVYPPNGVTLASVKTP